jgi:hypothetical protein
VGILVVSIHSNNNYPGNCELPIAQGRVDESDKEFTF